MARIRKVTKTNRGVNVCNEDNTEKKMEKNLADVNPLNSRKLCNNDRNRRILLTLKSYPNLYQSTYFANNYFTSVRNNSVTSSTQTVKIEETSTLATQTDVWMLVGVKSGKKSEKNVKISKSDSSLMKKSYRNQPTRIFGALRKDQEMFRTNEKKDIIILHKNENIDKYNLKKGDTTANKMNKKFKRKSYSKIPSKNLFHRKNKRKLRKFGNFAKNEEICSSYHKIIEKMGKFSLITISKWSSKLVRIVSDLGISITESLTNMYKNFEYQKCESLQTICNCQQFHLQMGHLLSRIHSLESNLHVSQVKLNEQQKKIDNTEDLERKIDEMKRKLESYEVIKSELADIRKQLSSSSAVVPPKPPVPPPPPPLPVFSISAKNTCNTFLKMVHSEKKLISYENPRPMITLEDILNVKLKKTSVTNI